MKSKELQQLIFDQSARHLLTQGKKSGYLGGRKLSFFQCQYRGLDGTKCAVGVLIRDEDYDARMEGKNASDANVVSALVKSLGASVKKKGPARLLADLQNIHDELDAADWASELRQLAERLRLSAGAIDAF